MDADLVLYDVEQRSAEWFAARRGIPTASEFHSVIANGKGGAPSKTRASYMRKLAAELVTEDVAESYSSADMDRGRTMEPAALDWYAFTRGVELQRVGFARRGNKGCSPDALVGDDGMVQIKTMRPDLLIELLEVLEHNPSYVPPEHKPQCQGELLVMGRQWTDLVIFWPKMPTPVLRVRRDDEYCAWLDQEVDVFEMQVRKLADKIRKMGGG